MHISGTALGFVGWAVLSPCRPVEVWIVVGVRRTNELIQIRKILKRPEIVAYRPEACVEHAFLQPVCVLRISSHLEEISERPCIVRHDAGLVPPMHAVASRLFCRTRASIRQHVVANEFAFSVDRLLQVSSVPCIGVEKHGYLKTFRVGHAVHVERIVV